MNAQDLWPEIHDAANNLRPEHLTRLGVTTNDALAAGGLGAVKITPLSDGLYEPGGDLSAAIVPVFWGPIPSESEPTVDWELLDLLAFSPSNPDQFWLRRGDADLLGGGALGGLWLDAPLQIHRTPLGWLQAGAAGCVVLNWKTAAPRLRAISTIDAEDVEHAHDMRRYLQQPLSIPEIRYPAATDRQAA